MAEADERTAQKMKKKLKDFFTENSMIKFLGLLLGVSFWLLLSNQQDPLIETSITCPIVYDDTMLETSGLAALSRPSAVTIPVSLRKSRLRYLSANDFTCTVDMSEIIGEIKEAPDTTKVNLEITRAASANYINSWEYPQSQSYVRVALDEIKTMSYIVQFNITNEAPEGYQIGQLISSPRRVNVTGPTSSFTSLAAVVAEVDLSQLDDDNTSVESPLALYDGNYQRILSNRLELSQDAVTVDVALNQVKDISVSLSTYSGSPANGYKVSKVDYSPKVISVMGSKTALAGISTVSIPSSALHLSGQSEKEVFTLDIVNYLPDGIVLADGEERNVEVSIEFEKLVTRTFIISTSGMTFVNTSDDYTYSIDASNTEITLSGFEEDLVSFEESFLAPKGTIDVAGMTEGKYLVIPVSMELDQDYDLEDEVTVPIRIEKKK